MPTDFYVKIGRGAKAPDGGTDDPLVGQLLIEPESGELSNQIEKSLDQPDEKFVEARDAFPWVDRHVMRRMIGMPILNDPKYAT